MIWIVDILFVKERDLKGLKFNNLFFLIYFYYVCIVIKYEPTFRNCPLQCYI